MKLVLNDDTRRFLPLEIELNEKTHDFKYYEATTEQERIFKEVQDTGVIEAIEKANYDLFWENFEGDENSVSLLKDFLVQKANVNTFMRTCNVNLGKLQIYV